MKNVNESGRSMVEMLGVLAIIGVLSIGGIAGYTLAMNRYRANEVLDTAAKIAIIAMSKNGGVGGDAGLTDLQLGSNSVPAVSSITGYKNGTVTIQFQSDYGNVVKLVGELAGNRVVGTCTESSTECTLDMNKAVSE